MMGTRSLTVFVDGDDEEIVVMYRHLDGYIEWYGKRLCAYLELFESENSANGMACLSAQTIMHFKSNIENPDYDAPRVYDEEKGYMKSPIKEGAHEGGIYLYPAGTREVGEEYIYVVKGGKKNSIYLSAYKAGNKEYTWNSEILPAVPDELIYGGRPSEKWITNALRNESKINNREEME